MVLLVDAPYDLTGIVYTLISTEQEKEESGNVDRDAIAHRLKQDVVSIMCEHYNGYTVYNNVITTECLIVKYSFSLLTA